MPSASVRAAPQPPPAPNAERYAWLGAEAGQKLKLDGDLSSRFPPPPGYTRVEVEPASFGHWLRGLPIAPPNTPVSTFDGALLHAADNDYVAGVVAIDIGNADLQQSPDVIIRLNAEWLWSLGQKAAISYRGSTKLAMPLSRWEKGQRIVSAGPNVFWAVKNKPKELDYAEFRRYLDAVFAWANSTSLAQRARRVPKPEELAPGDFFLHARAPGHVAIVLDVADKPSGERVALIGQALNPAQSLHIVRPGRATAWFSLRPGLPVLTANTQEFGWEELRRLEPLSKEDAPSVADEESPL
ncbi:MAG TPA: DUF4846 domain-containing protein [Polyangiaceae bacterium]|nr:DUF4846 domain-containing protein [Polyangiaceae bacterium]